MMMSQLPCRTKLKGFQVAHLDARVRSFRWDSFDTLYFEDGQLIYRFIENNGRRTKFGSARHVAHSINQCTNQSINQCSASVEYLLLLKTIFDTPNILSLASKVGHINQLQICRNKVEIKITFGYARKGPTYKLRLGG